MNRLGILALVALALLAAAAPALAGSIGRSGTAGAGELMIPVGPRGTALGGAVVGDVTGTEALFWNPAGLGALERTEATFSHTRYFADMKLNYAGIATHLGGFGVVGVSAKVLSVGDVFVTTEAAPEGTGEIANPTFTVLGLTWARQFTDRVRFGATANMVNEHIISESANGVCFDFGVQYLTGWRALKLGMVMKNFGPSMSFNGPGAESAIVPPGGDPSAQNRIWTTESAAFEMPSYFSLGATMDLLSESAYKVVALGAFQNNNFGGDEFRGGLEWSYRDNYALRASWYGSYRGTVDIFTGAESSKLGSGDDLYSGYAIGGGFKFRTGDTGKLGVDVSWRPVRDGLFDDTLDVGLKFSF